MAFDFPSSPIAGQVFKPSGGPTYVYDSPKWVVSDTSSSILNVKDDFGAKGDGVTDDGAAFQLALNSAPGLIYVPAGTYLLGISLKVNLNDVRLLGEGTFSTVLKATHSAGPVIRFMEWYGGLSNLTIDSSAARIAGGAGANSGTGSLRTFANYGILVEGEDLDGGRPLSCTFSAFIVQNQPSHGMVFVAYSYQATINDGFRVINNGGHGIVFDNGTMTNRSVAWRERPGLAVIESGRIADNVGHSIVVGALAQGFNYGVRVDIRQMDIGRNALASGVRKGASNLWIYGENCLIEQSGISGRDAAEIPQIECVRIAGRSHRLINNRYIYPLGPAVRIFNDDTEASTRDVTIDNMSIDVADTLHPLDPAVQVDPGAERVTVRSQNIHETTRLMGRADGTNVPGGVTNYSEIVVKQVSQTVNNSTTLVADDELWFPIAPYERVIFKCHIRHIGSPTANLKIAFTGPTGTTIRWISESGVNVNVADACVPDIVRSEGTSPTSPWGASSTNVRAFTISGITVADAAYGNVHLRWAQNTATVVDTRVGGRDLGGSYMEIFRGL